MTRRMDVLKRAPVRDAASGTSKFSVLDCTDEVMVFDTETTTDMTQRLRVGAALFRNRRVDTWRGYRNLSLFIGEELPPDERATVIAYAEGFAARVDTIITDQVRIRGDELRAKDTPAAMIEAATAKVRAAMEPLREWCARGGRVRVYKRDTFAVMMTDAMRGRLEWGTNTPATACAVVALNATFDLGAIAAPHPDSRPETGNVPVLAWGYEDPKTGEKGFGYHLCNCPKRFVYPPEYVTHGGRKGRQQRADCPDHPPIISRKLGGRKSQYGMTGVEAGPIMDLSVIGRALLGPGKTGLRDLGERMNATILKRKDETGHGDKLTVEYLDYLIVDILATSNLCDLMIARYREHNLTAPVASMFSEASVGKAYFNALGIKGDFRGRTYVQGNGGSQLNRNEVFALFEHAQESYQGARSEVMERLNPCTVIHCDFKSQYPSVNALMGLQSLLTGAAYLVTRGAPAVERASLILARADLAWLRVPKHWESLRIVVKVRVAGCRLPMKWDDPDTAGKRIFGMADLTSDATAKGWYPLSDVIASKLLTGGHMPVIMDAFEIATMRGAHTNEISFFGETLDLSKDDLFLRVIERRIDIKEVDMSKPGIGYNSDEYNSLDNIQNNLKLIANSTSYGVLAETVMSGRHETAGKYYAPFIATHITGGSRLLLAMAQTLAHDYGMRDHGTPIVHAMCDTDSMAFVQPNGVEYDRFEATITDVQSYFRELSPYRNFKDLFDRELPTKADGKKGVRAYFFGVSAKRYAMFNVVKSDDGRETIVLRKVSSHGLGHVRFDNMPLKDIRDEMSDIDDEDEDDACLIPLEKQSGKVPADQGHMWVRAIQRALGWRKATSHEPRTAGFAREDWNAGIARQPVAITTPGHLLEYQALGVRPGSFFMTLPVAGKTALKPCCPMASTTATIIAGSFLDKTTGKPITRQQIERLAVSVFDSLKLYFQNPERKAVGLGKGVHQAPGRLALHRLAPMGVSHRNRKGQGMAPDLFDIADSTN